MTDYKYPGPTAEQTAKVEELKELGYTWDKEHSAMACGVVMAKGNDIWFFGLTGEIIHNPDKL